MNRTRDNRIERSVNRRAQQKGVCVCVCGWVGACVRLISEELSYEIVVLATWFVFSVRDLLLNLTLPRTCRGGSRADAVATP
jgi:hypothetical protein